MAPRKEKSEAGSNDQGTELILGYLTRCREAESTILLEVSANLHNKVTKAYATKALKTLHETGLVAGKFAGKQAVYHAIQNPADVLNPTELAALDTEIINLRDAITNSKAQERLLRSHLSSLNSTVSTDELRATAQLRKSQNLELQKHLKLLKSAQAKPVSAEERAVVDKAWNKWSIVSGKRRKICLELWKMLTEEVPEGTSREDLWAEWGLEEDRL